MLPNTRLWPRIILAVVVLCCGHGLPPGAAGQALQERPVFVAIPETFPVPDAKVALIREPGRDIVLLREGTADPESLWVGLRLLRRVASERGGPPEGRAQLIPITGFSRQGTIPPETEAHLRETLDRLSERSESNVGNLGWGRWLRYVPREG